MVTETIEVPVEATPQEGANPAPEEAPQTETQTGAVAAPEEDVASEPETETEVNDEPPTTPPERTYTEAELREQARILAQHEREAEQQRNRAEAGRRAYYQQLEQEQKAERAELLKAALDRGDDPEAVLERYDRKREGQWLDRSVTIADEAIVHLAAAVQGETPVISDPRVQAVYDRFQQSMQIAYDAGWNASQGQIAEQFTANSEIPKLVKAEFARINAKAREGQKPINRTEGSPSPADTTTDQDRLDRLSGGRATAEDKQWFAERRSMRSR